ncbi:MAG: hypothetical protein IJE59_02585 [Clostridia bacterium]|nr:hypothetical protein [Clostridia bacterium]
MKEFTIFFPELTAKLFGKFLLILTLGNNKESEMFFSTDMIYNICREENYPCYKFGVNLEKCEYWRMRMNKITLEYIVIPEVGTDDYNAYVYQIFQDGKLIYKKMEEPKKAIYLCAC